MKRIFYLLTCFLILPLVTIAQTERITLEEAINIALENNYQLQLATNNLDLAEFEILNAKADFLPTLSYSQNASIRQGRQFITASDEFGDFVTRSTGGSLSSSLTVFNGFSNISNLRGAQFEKLSREENLQRMREEVIFGTATRFLDYLLSVELLDIAEANLETSQQQLEQIQAQVDVGSRPTVDRLNQESVVANNELEVTNRENEVNFSRLVLIRQLQIDPLGEYEFVSPDIEQELASISDYDLIDLVQAALDNRSDLKSEENSIKAAEYQLKIAKANLLPTLNLNASVSSDYALAFLDGESRESSSFRDQFFDENINKFVGLSLSIPIFGNLDRRATVKQQEVNYKNAQLNFENTRLQVIQEVNQAYNDYASLIKRLDSSQKALVAAERAYETEQQRYEVGASTLIELSQANNAYVEAQSNRIQAVYNFVFQEKLLDYYIGRLTEQVEF